jgi:SAM-dependent methyltransferase
MAEFDAWAEFYDRIHRGLPGEAEFYVGQAVRLRRRVLELGCGTGRLAIPMAMSGVHVVGLDISKPMLDVCQESLRQVGKVSGSLSLLQADMAEFALGATFGLVVMAYRTFMHLLTPGEQRACLKAIRDHLEPDGLLMLNVWAAKPTLIAPHARDAQSAPVLAGQYPAPTGTNILLHYCSSAYDEYRQLISEEHLIHEVSKRGVIKRKVELSLLRAWTTPREMDNLARLCGFEVEAVFGDFDCNPFAETSAEMIWILRRAE